MSKALVLLKQLFGHEAAAPAAPVQTHFEQALQYGFGPNAMGRIKVCEACGRQSDSEKRICRHCGAHLPENNLYDLYRMGHRRCACCDAVLPKDGDFCPFCGFSCTDVRDTV